MTRERGRSRTQAGDATGGVMTRVDLDALAELEEERRFLLRSLADLEREHDAGDIDDGDYATLRDGYTVRAAAVLREIDGGRAEPAAEAAASLGAHRWRSPRWSSPRSVGIGFVLAAAWGERQSGQEITGFTPGDDARLLLRQRPRGDERRRLRARQLAVRPGGRDGAGAEPRQRARRSPTSAGRWRCSPSATPTPRRSRNGSTRPGSRSARRSSWSRSTPTRTASWRSSSSSSSRMPTAALPYVETCEASNPPSEVADLIEAFAADIRAAAT